MWAREGGALCPVGTVRDVLSVGRSGRTLGQPTKYVRTSTHKLKPIKYFTVVPHPLSPLRFNKDDTTYVLGLAPPSLERFGDETSATVTDGKPGGVESSTEWDAEVVASSTSPGSAGMVAGVWILRLAVALLLCGVCPCFLVSVAAAPTVSW